MSYQGKLAALWTALMLCYLLGDVLRLMDLGQGAGSIDGRPMSQRMFLLAAGMMLLPILMLAGTALLPAAVLKWLSAAAALFLFFINVFGINTYSGLYDKALIGVSLILNLMTIYLSFKG